MLRYAGFPPPAAIPCSARANTWLDRLRRSRVANRENFRCDSSGISTVTLAVLGFFALFFGRSGTLAAFFIVLTISEKFGYLRNEAKATPILESGQQFLFGNLR